MAEIALAGVAFDERKYDVAIAHANAAVQINPRSALAYVQLAEVQLFQNDKNAARKTLLKAIELDSSGHGAASAEALLKLVNAGGVG
jgi:tetratricopeptide (TPR) repeat protein